ncbi:hypothetical protein G6F57_002975 [Rhizopus arrhizus]|nr:hypothetical protein G6F30_000528 [Rhizopus arrhizus]KAG1424357.1 hypothetical protein G6F58_002422 [Rhizopus delemar]KAG0990199.1 hypothetical protein G6F29_000428 [Rhizopus arrhizus]KAG0999512.1 hypothetical protein G6F28_000942 [Rhizopus arrhizus]KAG1012281.1 hypothetical protein G6F27_002960 [Rhizopus arrhizus]
MIIPNEEEEDSVQPPSSSFYFHHTHEQEVEKEKSNIEYKVIPNLTWSAAAEAAALESLTFNNSMKQKYDNHQPKKVKRPPNAYLLFNRDMRRQMNNQGMTSGEISKNISQIWKQLSNEERNKYFKEESELKQQYNSSNFVYFRRSKAELQQAGLLKKLQKSNSTTIQHQQLQLQQSKKKVYYKKGSKTADESSIPDPRGRKKKKSSDTSLPKHPMSAYLHFAKTMRPIIKKNSPNSKLVEISQQIGLKWRSMTENEMRPWIEMANEDKARYAREMKDRINCNEELDSAMIATVAQMVYPNNDT